MGWKLRSATFATLAALVLVGGCPAPIYDPSTMREVQAEARLLMATYPVHPIGGWAEVPRNEWPPAIARLRPEMLTVWRRQVLITVKPFFDGGWGYEVPRTKDDLRMPLGCYRELSRDVYWHGPC